MKRFALVMIVFLIGAGGAWADDAAISASVDGPDPVTCSVTKTVT